MQEWQRFVDEFTPATHLRDEEAAIRVCRLALDALRLGTYGIGAILLDAAGTVMIEGHNQVFTGGFRSDLHAEMVVMNAYESSHNAVRGDLHACTLVTSLEPCPMCMTRLIFAGVGTVLFVSEDPLGGMVQRKSSLPPVFLQLSEGQSQVWRRAECSEQLRTAAFHIWDSNRGALDRRIAEGR